MQGMSRRFGCATRVVVAFALVAAAAGLVARHELSGTPGQFCHVLPVRGTGSTGYELDLSQAANASTIAAVGKRLGLPNHAVTIALAAAMLESKLHNLTYGDRDSLGLFQQRPSQGWGTPAQILTPRYAARVFFEHLARVANWQTLPVTVAAQRVQRSALPNGYAQKEGEARALASALTGEVSGGMACRADISNAPPTSSLTDAIAAEVGPAVLGTPLPSARGWTLSLWLVGHAVDFRVTSVTFGGMGWKASRGTWLADSSATATVAYETRPTR